MKKTLTLLALLSIIYSCKKSNDNTPVKTQSVPAKILVSGPSSFNNNASSQGSATYNLLGYGYDITGSYADTGSVRAVAIDVSAYDINNPGRFVIDLSKSSGQKVFNAENAGNLSQSLSAQLDETAGNQY